MTKGPIRTAQNSQKGPGKQLLASAAQLAFVMVAGVLTFVAFLTMNVFVQEMISKEYDRVSEGAAEFIVNRMDSLENSLESITKLLNFAYTANSKEALSSPENFGSYVENFHELVFITQTSKNQWRFQKLPVSNMNTDVQGRYQLASNQETTRELLTALLKNKYYMNNGPKVVVDRKFFEVREQPKIAGFNVSPFAIVMPIKQGDPRAGFVIGISHAGFAIDPIWFSGNTEIYDIQIHEASGDTSMIHIQKQLNDSQVISDQKRDFEFDFGGNRWEIQTHFVKEEKIFFLEALPYFVLGFGALLTIVGMLYLYTHQSQSHHVEEMNQALENKNKELEDEVVKRARLNKALRKSERENRAIVDAVSDIIFETDTSGKFLFLNSTWQKITGFDPDQSRGLDFIKMLHPEDQEKHKTDFKLLVNGKKNAYRSFTRLRTSDGTFRAVELAVSMIRQDESRNLRVVGTFTDVEERRRAERALAEAEKKYRTIVENAAGGIFQLTPEGLYLSANPALARILGYESAQELLNAVKNANEEIYVNQRERDALMVEVDRRNIINNYEVQVIRKNGEKIWVNENIRVVRDDSGNVLYYEGSLEDITQRKESELALREAKINSDLANRAKSEFLANMSHELRTPLNSIIGFSEIIKNEAFGEIEQDSYKEYAKDIFFSGRKLLEVINEILDISKIEAGDRALNESMVSIGGVVGVCLNLLDTKAKANQLVIQNEVADGLSVIGEELAIKQMLVNLLSNAIKFTPNGGRITIASDVNTDGELRLSVSDTGIGLEESEIEKALSPFGQIDNALNRSNAGTGLGLTLVDSMIKLHGGKLELFSQKGIGTTASIIFPVERVAVQKQEPKESTGEEAKNPAHKEAGASGEEEIA